MVTYEQTPWLHIRGQFTYHGEAYVVGNRAGLKALRDAIDAALVHRDAETTAFANDGEGYFVTVRRTSRLRDMGDPPYIDNLARAVADYEREWMRKRQRHNWDIYQLISRAKAETAQTDSVADEVATGETPNLSSGA